MVKGAPFNQGCEYCLASVFVQTIGRLGHLKTLRSHALRVGVGKTASGHLTVAID
jgi:hypothetical protein